ncbi:MAG: hypothetical protein QE271_14510 [Bacteriovoracaceae bacterium]|nr:hypothetical protein [Bacteriovoracaceae bacterium]
MSLQNLNKSFYQVSSRSRSISRSVSIVTLAVIFAFTFSSCMNSDQNDSSPGIKDLNRSNESVVENVKFQCSPGACPEFVTIIPSETETHCLGFYVAENLVMTNAKCLPSGFKKSLEGENCPWSEIYGISRNKLVRRTCRKIYYEKSDYDEMVARSSALSNSVNSEKSVLIEVDSPASMDYLYEPNQGTRHNYATNQYQLVFRSRNDWSLIAQSTKSIPFSTYFSDYESQFSPVAYINTDEFPPTTGSPVLQNGVITAMADPGPKELSFHLFKAINLPCLRKNSYPELFNGKECRIEAQNILDQKMNYEKMLAVFNLTRFNDEYDDVWPAQNSSVLPSILMVGEKNYLVTPYCYKSVDEFYEYIKKNLQGRKFRKKSKYELEEITLSMIHATHSFSIGSTLMSLEGKEKIKASILIDMTKYNESYLYLNKIPMNVTYYYQNEAHTFGQSIYQCPEDDNKFLPIEVDPTIVINP